MPCTSPRIDAPSKKLLGQSFCLKVTASLPRKNGCLEVGMNFLIGIWPIFQGRFALSFRECIALGNCAIFWVTIARSILVKYPGKGANPFLNLYITKNFRYQKCRYWTLQGYAWGWIFPYISRFHVCSLYRWGYKAEGSSILGTWNVWWIFVLQQTLKFQTKQTTITDHCEVHSSGRSDQTLTNGQSSRGINKRLVL